MYAMATSTLWNQAVQFHTRFEIAQFFRRERARSIRFKRLRRFDKHMHSWHVLDVFSTMIEFHPKQRS